VRDRWPRFHGKHVGIQGSRFWAEEGRRAKVEGYIRVVKADGRKIDDMVFTRVE
jgi:hypothetical protein